MSELTADALRAAADRKGVADVTDWRRLLRKGADALDSALAERDRLRERLEAETLRRIEAENPGIDIEDVKARRARPS